MSENLLISNFNHKKPELISVRKNGQNTSDDIEQTEAALLWNLAFVLDNLFGSAQ